MDIEGLASSPIQFPSPTHTRIATPHKGTVSVCLLIITHTHTRTHVNTEAQEHACVHIHTQAHATHTLSHTDTQLAAGLSDLF